jgi:CBS domain-containing protein
MENTQPTVVYVVVDAEGKPVAVTTLMRIVKALIGNSKDKTLSVKHMVPISMVKAKQYP